MATEVTANHPVAARQRGHPVVPEARAAAEAMLDPDRLGGRPGVREVVTFVMRLIVVGSDFRHVPLLPLWRARIECCFDPLLHARPRGTVGLVPSSMQRRFP